MLDSSMLPGRRNNQLPAEFPLERAREIVRIARADPANLANPADRAHLLSGKTFGGVCECYQTSTAISGLFNAGAEAGRNGAVRPANVGGDHDVFEWHTAPGQNRVVIDATAAQFTEYVRGTAAGSGKNLIPVSRLQQGGLVQPVQEGIFTPSQHEEFCRLVQQYVARRPG